MKTKNILKVLVVLIALGVAKGQEPTPPSKDEPVVATIYGEPLFANEIVGLEGATSSVEKVGAVVAAILPKLFGRFDPPELRGPIHPEEISDEEAVRLFQESMKEAGLPEVDLGPIDSELFQNGKELLLEGVAIYKQTKIEEGFEGRLHAKYGGRVAIISHGDWTSGYAVDARKAFVQEREAQGDLVFIDPQLREQFWAAFDGSFEGKQHVGEEEGRQFFESQK